MVTVTGGPSKLHMDMTEREAQELGAFLQSSDVGVRAPSLYKHLYMTLHFYFLHKYSNEGVWGNYSFDPLDNEDEVA